MFESGALLLILKLVDWLEKRYAKRKVVEDLPDNPEPLRRIGKRVREWEDHNRARGDADATGDGDSGPGDGLPERDVGPGE